MPNFSRAEPLWPVVATFVKESLGMSFWSDTSNSGTPCAKVDPHTNVDLESRSARGSGLLVLQMTI